MRYILVTGLTGDGRSVVFVLKRIRIRASDLLRDEVKN